MSTLTALEALKQLQEGNKRFTQDINGNDIEMNAAQRTELVEKQEPAAIILGCADARVPAEIVFDVNLGDLFVVRVAGNIVTPTQIGSIEYAVHNLGTRLIVVLGHSSCGAVAATVDSVVSSSPAPSPGLDSLISKITPAVKTIMSSNDGIDTSDLIAKSVKENVSNSVKELQNDSDILKDVIQNDGLLVVGAEYDLATGAVNFFENMPS